MFALYTRTSPELKLLEKGVARWNDERAIFLEHTEIHEDSPMLVYGHPIPWQAGQQEWLMFG